MDESKCAPQHLGAALAAPASAAARNRLPAKCAFLAVLVLILFTGPHSTASTCAERSDCYAPALSAGTAGILPALSGTAGILPTLSFSASAAPAPALPADPAPPAMPAPSPESPQTAQPPQPPPPQQPPAASSPPPSQPPQQPTAPPRKKITAPPAQSAPPPNGEGAANFRDDNPGARERWFYEQRAFPLGFIPFGIRQRAVAAREAMRDRERRLGIDPFPSARSRTAQPDAVAAPFPQTIPANMTTWTPIGPQPTSNTGSSVGFSSGRVSAVAVDPTNANRIYIGGAQGGIWRSTDGGNNWTPLTDDRESLAIGSIAIAPSNPQTIYVGTGEATNSIGSYYGAGILKSTNGGDTWTQLGQSTFVGPFGVAFMPGGGARVGSLAVHPTNPQLVLAGVQINTGLPDAGIYCSDDGGVTWTRVLEGAVGTEVVYDPTPPSSTAYAALGRIAGDAQNGVYRSTAANQPCASQVGTWQLRSGSGATALPTGTATGRTEIAIAPSNPQILYASISNAVGNSADLLGMFKTTDGGATWNPLGTGAPFSGTASFCSSQCFYDQVIKVHPNDANVVYAGGAANAHFFTRSTNGGTVWTPALAGANGNRLHVDQHAFAFAVSGATVRLIVGNDGGVWSSDVTDAVSGAINWTNHNANLNITQFYPGHSMAPATVDIGFGGTQDNGSQKFTGNLQWERILGGDGGWTAIDPSTPGTVYATCQFICINKSTASGNIGTFVTVETGINANDPVQFIAPLIIDAAMPNRLYFGTDKVYQTIDGATSWTAISPSLGGEITTIAVAPSNSAFVYAGNEFGDVFVSTNVGNGTPASFPSMSVGLPSRSIRQIAVDPIDPMTAYVTFSGFSGFGGDTSGHVFKTDNGGISWTDISVAPFSTTPLPNTPVNDIVIDPNIPGTLYVGTDVGVFVTPDGGLNWMTLQSGFPNVAVLGLKLHPSRILRAGTHGRGMWDLQLPAGNATFQIQSLAPSNVNAGSGAFQLTVNGIGFTMQSQVRFNGTIRNTIFNSSNQLLADILAADVASGGTAQISVEDPVEGISNTLPFSINNPAPTLTSISPNSASPGAPGLTLTVNGTNFVGTVGGAPTSEVRWNGSPRTTNAMLVSPSQITVDIPASDLASPGINQVTVFNPGPGGGTTTSQTFTVGTPPPNDDFANAIVIGATPFTDMQNNAAATTETNDPVPQPSAGCPAGSGFPNLAIGRAHSIWYRFTPMANVAVDVDTIGSAYDSVLSVWTGPALGSLTQVNCDDDGVSPGGPSRLTGLALTAGATFHFMVAGFDASQGGATVFNFSIPADFALSANPTAVTVARGQSGMSTITATPMNGSFGNAITFSCSGLPAQSTCVFNPTSVTPGASPATTQLTITTTAPAIIPGAPLSYRWTLPPVYVLALTLLALLLFAAGLTLKGSRATRWLIPGHAGLGGGLSACRAEARRYIASRHIASRSRAVAMACHVAAVLILVGLAVACGGGGGTPSPTPNQGTPTGTFSVTVRGTAGAVQRTTVVTLTVQ